MYVLALPKLTFAATPRAPSPTMTSPPWTCKSVVGSPPIPTFPSFNIRELKYADPPCLVPKRSLVLPFSQSMKPRLFVSVPTFIYALVFVTLNRVLVASSVKPKSPPIANVVLGAAAISTPIRGPALTCDAVIIKFVGDPPPFSSNDPVAKIDIIFHPPVE